MVLHSLFSHLNWYSARLRNVLGYGMGLSLPFSRVWRAASLIVCQPSIERAKAVTSEADPGMVPIRRRDRQVCQTIGQRREDWIECIGSRSRRFGWRKQADDSFRRWSGGRGRAGTIIFSRRIVDVFFPVIILFFSCIQSGERYSV